MAAAQPGWFPPHLVLCQRPRSRKVKLGQGGQKNWPDENPVPITTQIGAKSSRTLKHHDEYSDDQEPRSPEPGQPVDGKIGNSGSAKTVAGDDSQERSGTRGTIEIAATTGIRSLAHAEGSSAGQFQPCSFLEAIRRRAGDRCSLGCGLGRLPHQPFWR